MAQVPLYFRISNFYPVSEVLQLEIQQNSMPVFRAVLSLACTLVSDGKVRQPRDLG